MGVGPHAHHGAENSVGCETPPPIPTGLQTSFVGRYPQHGAEDPLFLWGLCWGLVFGVVGAPEGPEKRGMSWHPQLVSNSLVNHPHTPNVHDPKSVSIPQVFQLQRPRRAVSRPPAARTRCRTALCPTSSVDLGCWGWGQRRLGPWCTRGAAGPRWTRGCGARLGPSPLVLPSCCCWRLWERSWH